MVKVVLFDADGVVINPHMKYFSVRYSEDYNIPVEKLLPFFTGEFQDCMLGLADLRKVLPKYLAEWGWEGGMDKFLDYWFSSESEVNRNLIDYIDKLRKTRIKCCLASNNEKYRAAYISAALGLSPHFDDMFFSHDLKLKKENPKFFEKVLQILKAAPSDVVFIGDSISEVDSAVKVGIASVIYESVEVTKKEIKKILSEG